MPKFLTFYLIFLFSFIENVDLTLDPQCRIRMSYNLPKDVDLSVFVNSLNGKPVDSYATLLEIETTKKCYLEGLAKNSFGIRGFDCSRPQKLPKTTNSEENSLLEALYTKGSNKWFWYSWFEKS
jgi:hypothetical protein